MPSETTVILTAVAIYLAYWVIRSIPYWLKRSRSDGWPSVPATIQTCDVRTRENSGFGAVFRNIAYECVFGYEYFAAGERYSGYFVQATVTEGIGNQVRTQLLGRHVNVRYDPANPGVSLVEETVVGGRPVLQNPNAF